MTGFRLKSGGLINRSKQVTFSFDRRIYRGFEGDTLASALIANGVMLMGRSFKYHRPRGPVTAGSAEPNALVEVGEGARREPNVRATMLEISDGLTTKSQNRWPSLKFDIGAVNQSIAPFLVAGFYYKTFMWPKSFWEKVYEPIIRKAAGLGTASHEPDPDRYEKAYTHCDVLVIGSGPAGLSAALSAARTGARVIIADESTRLGGSLLFEDQKINGLSCLAWADAAINELKELENVQILTRTTVFGRYDGNVYGALERVQKHVTDPDNNKPAERNLRIFTRQTILASGAQERPLVFGGNDHPGVMQAGAVREFVVRYGVSPGRCAVIFTNNSSGYATARCLAENGVPVA
ncbi:MAG TPA: FAD-dependent oxidoreductase, partial [Rhizobiales bacterium]|nr:FAD-dependent oxidoreductase [Hyphomicrobiales bacterium]